MLFFFIAYRKGRHRVEETIFHRVNISHPCIIELAGPLILLAGQLI